MVRNEVKSAANFCPQVAAWFPDMFCNFYFLKNIKVAKNSTIATAREKISTNLKSLEFQKFFTYIRLNLKTIKFYLIKLATEFYWQPCYLLSERASLMDPLHWRHLLVIMPVTATSVFTCLGCLWRFDGQGKYIQRDIVGIIVRDIALNIANVNSP